ncbi:NAC domain-containing protein 14 [Cocos nucifera]|uniref:NAC domain-containing protein 14 n=1 Tax=Cocos nucifera TaxID=13894 RepID=A0A8K0IKB1_COCNU|nr:NAC domain-containing protein 14 [Cocos nucifera]
MMTIAPGSLPVGFRFHPTDEELVNVYLKRKISGRIKTEIEIIPEIDILKCEPWDLPDKSIIRSDDPEWFFFAPKDRKYANGNRSNRATEAGYWKATGKDRSIRSKAAPGRNNVIGMKKTLVFHRGRAPKGIRTRWIMHEYRTTEPVFESGDQGGYVLYRLFKKPEEKGSNSKAEEMEKSGFSPTPTKSSPNGTLHEEDSMEEISTPVNQKSPESGLREMEKSGFSPTLTKSSLDGAPHEEDSMEEISTPVNQESPGSGLREEPQSLPDSVEQQPTVIKRWLTDNIDCSGTCSVAPDERSCNVASDNHDAKAGMHIHSFKLVFMILACILACTRYTNQGIINLHKHNQESPMEDVDDADRDSFHEFLDAVLCNPDEYSAGASDVQKNSVAETVPRHGIWDSASFRDSGTSSDIGTEAGLAQEHVSLEASEWAEEPSFMLNDLLRMNSSHGYPEIEPHLSALYENASLLPYDSTGPDVYSVDPTSESLQYLFDSMEESSNQKNIANNGDGHEVSGIKFRPRHLQHPSDSMNLSAQEGTITSRFHLQGPVQNASFASAGSESSSNGDDHEDREAMKKALQDLFDGTEESLTQKDAPSNEDGFEGTGIKIKTWKVRNPPNELSSKQRRVFGKIRLQSSFEVGSFSAIAGESSSSKDDQVDGGSTTEAGEHVDDNLAEFREISKPALPDKLEQLSIHDDATHSSELYQESKPLLRLRTKGTYDNADVPKDPPSHPGISRTEEFTACSVSLA